MSRPSIVLQRSFPFMLLWASVLHYAWGIGLAAYPPAGRLAVFGGLNTWLEIGVPRQGFAIILILCSTLAAYGIFREETLKRKQLMLLLGPQYIILLISLVSDALLIVDGEYQGTELNRWVIFIVLAPVISGAVLHTAAILERYFFKWAPE